MEKTAKSMLGMDFEPITQFELTKKIVNNLKQFELTPTAKLVLLYLSTCYNPNNKDIFPKQLTIALTLGISERSVVRAINELTNAGIILIECKHRNRYSFTDKLSVRERQKVTSLSDKLSPDKQTNKQNKKQTVNSDKNLVSVSDFETLKKYAVQKGAKKPAVYARKIIQSGNAATVINEVNMKLKADSDAKKRAAITEELLRNYRTQRLEAAPPPQAVIDKLEKLRQKLASRIM